MYLARTPMDEVIHKLFSGLLLAVGVFGALLGDITWPNVTTIKRFRLSDHFVKAKQV